jgi:ATP-dependent DNA helicase RecG
MSDRVIPSLLITLLDRLQGRESLELEFKAARVDLPKDLWPTASAFANTQGGWIVLGVKEEDSGVTLEGVARPSALLQTFYNHIRNTQKISFSVCGANDTSIEQLGDKHVVVIRVPAAPRKVRPIYINNNPYGGTYVRRHAGDYQCSKQEVDRMMREASDAGADSTILKHLGWTDLDHDALARYRRRFQTQSPGSPWNKYNDQRFLQAIGGYRHDRETGDEGITVAGLLLVGSPEALQEWRTRHLIDYRLVPGDADTETRWEDRVVWEGNLLGAFEELYPRLVAGQPIPFHVDRGTRVDESPVHIAVREALVNLLVHTDYAETQASLIKRSPEGYLFRNPGSSRVSEIDLLTGDRSDPRNPILVRMFRQIGLCEEAGTGMPKIIRTWRQLGFRLPAIDVGTERYEFTLGLRHAHLLLDEDRAWLQSLGETWDESEQLALVVTRHEGEIDNPKLRRLTGQHPADVTKVLGSLRDRGLLQMIGGGRFARYQLGPVATTNVGDVPLLSQEMREEEHLTQQSFLDTMPGSGGLAASSGGLAASSGGVWADLQQMSRVVREQRYIDAETRNGVLIQLCSQVPLSLRELADLLGRSLDYVRDALRPLIASGRLTFLYPEQPSHPHQKYMAVQSSEGNVSVE